MAGVFRLIGWQSPSPSLALPIFFNNNNNNNNNRTASVSCCFTVVHDVLCVFYNVLQVFHEALQCIVSCATIGSGACTISNFCEDW